ncbi:hypothetical protein K2173_027097 [Erythroxylum novogranatense]|uniref:Protein kinase domain-containing protein n=1 Tax=Erythroxylum novogranatense TaxID=1862640 RepID=A0AAV8U0N7_9ROSI|nr:hypothetical protein K2173_027097 [Erythroxylum novogranatense]
MGSCPCFGFFNGKKRKSDNKKKHSSHELRRVPSNVALISDSSNQSATSTTAPKRAITLTYEELAIATNSFSHDSFLGRGGFGAVFKGRLERNGQVVAVKQLDQSGFQGDKEFLVEVLMLSLMQHLNLVNLIGFCAEGNQRLLVYEYMPLGSLEDHLFDLRSDVEPLDWNKRMKIAAGTAKGLDFLHSANPPVIYRDLKASNILLGDDFQPKLSDFGLAKFGPSGGQSHVSTRVMGTYGYCAPEYASSGKLTMKTDIYSYGILLLELITGRRAVEEVKGHQKYLIQWALPLMKDPYSHWKLADPLLKGQYSNSLLNKAIEVAAFCVNENANSRPTSKELVVAMDYLVSRKYEPKEDKKVKDNWPEIHFSPTETAAMMEKDLDRDRAVAEAKLWGETCREKRRQENVVDDNTRYQLVQPSYINAKKKNIYLNCT